MNAHPTIAKLKALLDEIRIVADEAASLSNVLPGPYALIVQQTAHAIAVADDAFKAIP